MTQPPTPTQQQQWQAALLARRAQLDRQRRYHLDGQARPATL